MPERFKYPEQPIIFIAISHLFNCLSYIIHFLFGTSASCTSNTHPVLIKNGPNGNSHCSVVFIIWEYFLFSATFWWLILAYSWLLASKFKYSVEAVEAKSTLFHAIGWGVPGLLLGITLVSNSVHADPLTGMCKLKYGSLLYIVPETIIIILSLGMMSISLTSMCRIQKSLQKYNLYTEKSERLENLTYKILKFSFIYMFPKGTLF